jgi:hypothetical protein
VVGGRGGRGRGRADREQRLASLKLVQPLLAKRGRALILFDEAEDALVSDVAFLGPLGGCRRGGSKVYANRLPEQSLVPVLWTCNDIDGIDPAVLRRVTLAIEVRTPSAPVRARIWRRLLDEAELGLGEDAVRRLSGAIARLHLGQSYKVLQWVASSYERAIRVEYTQSHAPTKPLLRKTVNLALDGGSVIEGRLKRNANPT